jgi:hypothetical protein
MGMHPITYEGRLNPMDKEPDEKQLLANIAKAAQERQLKRVAGAPEVGIFWVVNDKPVIDGMPLNEAEDYGGFKTHGRSHDQMWPVFQRNDIVPRDVEYDEVPRGRVVYSTKTRSFTFFADRCILKNKSLTNRIKESMHLPNTVKNLTDSHYRCSGCIDAALFGDEE